ncbi:hypothetical protein MalM14_50350 [Gimesia chilikensis]|nr:hypothetical protein MalM14_50350 [Gimesia chilikensis]
MSHLFVNNIYKMVLITNADSTTRILLGKHFQSINDGEL